MILILLTDWVNQKQTRPPTLLLGSSLEEPETIFIKKLKSNAPGKPTSERVFINENLTKRNKHLFSLANEERKKFNWKYIWANNGRILLRQSNDSRVIAIRSEKDIEHIKNPMDNPRNPN